jgi:enamine deaminase RidA (YjgF/YER057c/UK114 family)
MCEVLISDERAGLSDHTRSISASCFTEGLLGNGGPFLEAAVTEGTTSKRAVRRYVKREAAQARAYSQAVTTEGGKIIWLAGQVAAADASGRSLAGDFDGQVREIFSRLSQTLEEAGGILADMVTMTVFITDARFGDRFTQLRKEIFGDNFPASALITVAGLAGPELLVEVQGIAVIG